MRTDVDVIADVCSLPFNDSSFDMVIANHVLEHVLDDHKAMAELFRVTAAGGRAILQTPTNWKNETTDEGPVNDLAERIARFGQADHVRSYGRDMIGRLQAAGWLVDQRPVANEFPSADRMKYGLEDGEIFLQIRR